MSNGHNVTIGGERLGSGKKMKAHLRNYERSTHDLSYTWRSTMAAGTLVPFMTEVALPGDTFDIELHADVLTHPTIGPLFGSYKLQLDIFQVPMRLYIGQLHMNMLGIGMNMSNVLMPQLKILGRVYTMEQALDNQHINPSCIFSYLGIRGLGQTTEEVCERRFNAIPYIAYWDIYKQYYANKQEEIGMVIHRPAEGNTAVVTAAAMLDSNPPIPTIDITPTQPYVEQAFIPKAEMTLNITLTGLSPEFDPSSIFMIHRWGDGVDAPAWRISSIDELFADIQVITDFGQVMCSNPINGVGLTPYGSAWNFGVWNSIGGLFLEDDINNPNNLQPILASFPLSNIDDLRLQILSSGTSPIVIDHTDNAPYGLALDKTDDLVPAERHYSATFNQEGLGIKTYQSDLFNNWISTEWIDGVDGISAITAVDTSSGSFTIDELNLSKKVYDMLNRIAISGGTYDDWLDAVYTHDRQKSIENPMYMGGLIKNVVFQEVVSNSAQGDQPLGTLAGRGKLGGLHKGGKIICKVDEPSYIMGIVSLTPNIDYSQGNKWDTVLRSMNDLHKPALDEIGFQDLITDQLAHWDTTIVDSSTATYSFKSAGKQPAWVNYMTNVDVVRGNFADSSQQMFMILNRRYGAQMNISGQFEISDLTTYIDPVKCNYIFADTRRDAQNFWTQIGANITARRKMSAKIMPNL